MKSTLFFFFFFSSLSLLVVTTLLFFTSSSSTLVNADTLNGVGYNMMRPKLNVARQPHQVQWPEEDTSGIAPERVREAAVTCDPTAPVQRTVVCEIQTFDECGNRLGTSFNATQGWQIVIEELDHDSATNPLVSPIIWLQEGIGRFYFSPLRVGPHRVTVTRLPQPLSKLMDLTLGKGIGYGGGYIVRVHDPVIKGLSDNIGKASIAVQRMIWAQASHNAELRTVPPATPVTQTFEDKEHRFDDRRFGMLQQDVRRPPVQPETYSGMPQRPARLDDNAHRIVDFVGP